MKKISAAIGSFFLVFFSISCQEGSDSTEPIRLYADNQNLYIQNSTGQRVYLLVVEEGFSSLIDWIPHFEEPYVEGQDSLRMSLNDVLNGKWAPVKSGDEIHVYWWTDNYGTARGVLKRETIRLP